MDVFAAIVIVKVFAEVSVEVFTEDVFTDADVDVLAGVCTHVLHYDVMCIALPIGAFLLPNSNSHTLRHNLHLQRAIVGRNRRALWSTEIESTHIGATQ